MNESRPTLDIAVIEDDPVSAGILKGIFRQETAFQIEMTWYPNLSEGMIGVRERDFDAVLLDLSLPDSIPNRTLSKVREISQRFPVIVVTGDEDLDRARRAVHFGAEDCLIKGRHDRYKLVRTIVLAIERHHSQRIIQNTAFKDQLTGLDNRAFFLSVAASELKIAKRTEKKQTLILLELSPVSKNREEQMLQSAARCLQSRFRTSDLISRFDERILAILGVNSDEHGNERVLERLEDLLEEEEIPGAIGCAVFDPASNRTIEDLLAEAMDKLEENRQTMGLDGQPWATRP